MSEVIHTLLERSSLSVGPEDVAKLVAGFEAALTKLGLNDRNHLVTALVAQLIIQLATEGERDPKRLADKAIGIVRGSS